MEKTNRQILTQAINELSDIDLVFLRERLINNCEFVLENKDKIIDSRETRQSVQLRIKSNEISSDGS